MIDMPGTRLHSHIKLFTYTEVDYFDHMQSKDPKRPNEIKEYIRLTE